MRTTHCHGYGTYGRHRHRQILQAILHKSSLLIESNVDFPLHDGAVASSTSDEMFIAVREPNVGHARRVPRSRDEGGTLDGAWIIEDLDFAKIIGSCNVCFEAASMNRVYLGAVSTGRPYAPNGPAKGTGPRIPSLVAECLAAHFFLLAVARIRQRYSMEPKVAGEPIAL